MNKPDFLLFGEGNYNTLGVLHELGAIGIDPMLLIIGKSMDWKSGNIIGYSKFARRVVEVDNVEAGLAWIKEHFDAFIDGTIIYPTSDITEMLLDKNYDNLSLRFKFPNAGREGAVSRLMDKKLQSELARLSGLRILESQFTTSSDFSFDKVKYPCMVKPLNSTAGSKGDMRVCENEVALREALQNGKHTHQFVVQQYIRNEADLLFLGVSFSDGQIWIPAVVIKPGVSPTGEYTHAIVSTDVGKYLPEVNEVRDFVKSTGYVGPFSIEFGVERGKNYFFEINLRNDGTSHYPLAAGVNIAQAYIQGAPTSVSISEYEMIDEVGDLRRVLSRDIGLIQWIRSILNAGTYRFYTKGDIRLIIPLIKMFTARTAVKILKTFKIKHNKYIENEDTNFLPIAK